MSVWGRERSHVHLFVIPISRKTPSFRPTKQDKDREIGLFIKNIFTVGSPGREERTMAGVERSDERRPAKVTEIRQEVGWTRETFDISRNMMQWCS